MTKRRDANTLDLFEDWTPPVVAAEFDPARIAGVEDSYRISRALGEAAGESNLTRDEIHAAMEDHLGKEFSRDVLNRIFAPSAEHEFTLSKFVAFLRTVPDLRVVNELLKGTGFVAIPERFIAAIEEAQLAEQIAELETRKSRARRSWKGPRS